MSDNEGTEASAPDAGGADDDGTVEVNAASIVDRVEQYDETLATEVRALVTKARELNARVTELEAADEDAASTTDDDVIAAEPVPDAEGGEDGVVPEGDEAADAEEVAALRERVAALEAELEETREALDAAEDDLAERDEEIDDLTSRLKRKQADFQNYKKRAKKRQEQIKDRATEDLVERLIEVRNNLKRGLAADHDDVESLASGIEMTLKEFDRILEDENVSEIDPEPGEEVDPNEHVVMTRVDSSQPEGRIHEVYSPGYRMADKVLEEAQVTVSTGTAPEGEEDAESADAAADGEADGGSDDAESPESTADDADEADDPVALGGDVDEGDPAEGEHGEAFSDGDAEE